MHEAYINKSAHTIYLVMELVEGLPLKSYIQRNQPNYSSFTGLPE